jgi:hypothetical protein
MIALPTDQQFYQKLTCLTLVQKQEVYNFMELVLKQSPMRQFNQERLLIREKIKPGIPGSQLLEFAGLIEESDLALMSEAIETSCRQVDEHEW